MIWYLNSPNQNKKSETNGIQVQFLKKKDKNPKRIKKKKEKNLKTEK